MFIPVCFYQVFLKDTDERACAYIAGPAPNRWGFTFEGKNLLESVNNASGEHLKFEEQNRELGNAERDLQGKLRAHPLFFAITMGLLQEIINSRYSRVFCIELYDTLLRCALSL